MNRNKSLQSGKRAGLDGVFDKNDNSAKHGGSMARTRSQPDFLNGDSGFGDDEAPLYQPPPSSIFDRPGFGGLAFRFINIKQHPDLIISSAIYRLFSRNSIVASVKRTSVTRTSQEGPNGRHKNNHSRDEGNTARGERRHKNAMHMNERHMNARH